MSKEKSKNSKKQSTKQENSFWKDYGNQLFAGIISVLTFVIILIAYYQTKITKDAMEFSVRPYIIIEKATAENINTFNPIVVKVMVSNVGKMPAYNTKFFHKVLLEKSVPKILQYPSHPDTTKIAAGAMLGKNMPYVIEDTIRITETTDIQMLRDKEIFLYIYGIIRYEALFKSNYFTKFCFRFNIETGKWSLLNPEHNKAN